MTEARGSAAYWNEVIDHVMERAKDQIDHVAKMVAASGYPPLTEPVTVKDLQKLPQEEAVAMLRDELARTTQVDPVTRVTRADPKTLDLAAKYLKSQMNQPLTVQGGA